MPCTSGTVIAGVALLPVNRFAFAENAVKESVVKDIELRYLSIASHDEIPYYLRAKLSGREYK